MRSWIQRVKTVININMKVYDKRELVLIRTFQVSSIALLICMTIMCFNNSIWIDEVFDLNLIKNGPSERRRFIDLELAQLDKVYLSDLSNYNRIVNQKNKLLIIDKFIL